MQDFTPNNSVIVSTEMASALGMHPWEIMSAALLGNKIWIKNLSTAGEVKWLYCLQSTSTNLRRIMLF